MSRTEQALSDLKALWNQSLNEPIPQKWLDLLARLK